MTYGKKNKKNKSTYRFYFLILFVFCVIFGKAYIYQIKEKSRLNQEIMNLQEKRDNINHDIEIAKSDLKNVDSEEFIKRVAREKLKMIEKNEVIVKYKDE